MNAVDRLRALADAMPEHGTVTFTRLDLLALLDLDDRDLPDDQPDLTLQQVADRFGRSTSTVRDWIRSGDLEGYKLRGREWRITPAALADFERKQRHGDLAAWRKMRRR